MHVISSTRPDAWSVFDRLYSLALGELSFSPPPHPAAIETFLWLSLNMSQQRTSATTSECPSSYDVACDHLLRVIARLLARRWCRLFDPETQTTAAEKNPPAANSQRFDRRHP